MSFFLMSNILSLFYLKFTIVNSLFFRTIFSFFTAFFCALIIGIFIIKKLHKFNVFQIIRDDGPQSHLEKCNTPTMGGIIVLTSIIISVMIFSDLSNIYIWYVLFTFLSYGALGLVDDILKIKHGNTIGLSALYKYFLQSLIALILIIVMLIWNNDIIYGQFELPFFIKILPQSDLWYIILIYFIIVGMSNAVNLSDGLDGLVVVPIILIVFALGIVAWISNHIYFSSYLNVVYLNFSGELVVVCAAIIGANLGFLWFNAYPAQIFMGDTGSLSLGGAIGIIAVLLHQEFLLLVMSSIFVMEILSVILQIMCFRYLGKRIFKMAPIHHHFELQGYSESKIVIRFWIITLILVIIGLVMLKI